jgi:hypothetical protein
MKPSNKILVLSLSVVCIIIFWLAPGINKSKASKYTRVYENTNVKRLDLKPDTLIAGNHEKIKTEKKNSKPEQKKIWSKESIYTNKPVREIDPKIFSRAMQFQEVLVLDSIVEIKTDSIQDNSKVAL